MPTFTLDLRKSTKPEQYGPEKGIKISCYISTH